MKTLLFIALAGAAIKLVGVAIKVAVIGIKIVIGFFKLSLGLTAGLISAISSVVVVFLGFTLLTAILKSLFKEDEIDG